MCCLHAYVAFHSDYVFRFGPKIAISTGLVKSVFPLAVGYGLNMITKAGRNPGSSDE